MKNQTKQIFSLIIACALSGISLSAFGQAGTVHFTADRTMRAGSVGHKYEMVSWDATKYREFVYWVENSSGGASEFMNYRVIFPAGYNPANSTKYPMIVMLHGAGESGRQWSGHFSYTPADPEYDNNGNNLLWGGREHRDAVTNGTFPGIVIFPQVSYNGAWSDLWDNGVITANERMAALIIEHMISTWDVDPYRIAVHGLSNGAKGVWDIAAKRPDLFAAVLPMSGVGTEMEAQTSILSTMPLWQFQGGTDTNPSQGNTNNWIKRLQYYGGSPRYTVYPSLGHGVWNTAYAEPDFFSWILSQNKRNITVLSGGGTMLCPGGGIKLGTSSNFLAYQWAKNGVDIAGATSRTYVATEAGSYTVRFRRRTDGVWDTSNPVTIQAPGSGAAPVLTSTGSTYLPIQVPGSVDNVLNLVAPTGYSQYQWYRNGALWATTTSNIKGIATGTGNNSSYAGSYTVQGKLAGGCTTSASNAIVVRFNDPQPTTPVFNILSRTPVSPTQINVTWENPAGETGFEIWRYRKGDFVAGPPATGYPLEKFKMVGSVGANVTSWADTGLRPGASYIYRVRAIVAGGAALATQPSPTYVATPADAVVPSAPSNLVATDIQATEISLGWTASTDNDNNIIYSYDVYRSSTLLATLRSDSLDSDRTDGNPLAPASYTVTGLAPNTSYTFRVRSRDYKGNVSSFSSITVSTQEANTNGVAYKYWEFEGTLSGLSAFNFGQTPAAEGVVNNFVTGVNNREDGFVVEYIANLQIDAPGRVRFYTNSDDGSRLYINGGLVINNDGPHAPKIVTSTYEFPSAGKYQIRVTYFDQSGGQTLVVKYNPGWANDFAAASTIPDSKLFLIESPPAGRLAAPAEEEVVVEEPIDEEPELVAWPMPFNNKLNLKFSKGQPIARVVVLDHMGNPVMSLPVRPFERDVEMDLPDLPPGQYYLVVGNQRIRVAKEN